MHFVNITYALCLLKDVIVMNKLSIYLASNVLTSLSVVFAGVKKIVFILSLYFHTMWNYIYSASRCWLGDWKGIWPIEISI